MRIAILGYGKEGRSAVEYWGTENEVTVCDINENITVPEGVATQLGEDYLENLGDFHLIVRSPNVYPGDIVAANDARILKKVTSVTEEFFRNCPAPIIGVTGTKGKGTTSSLITKILQTAGKTVHLGGNIGIAPLEMLNWGIKSEDIVVLELSSFQLIDLRVSPSIGVCLMLAAEHLDWHKDMGEYIQAKQNMFRHQSSNDHAIFNRLNDFSDQIASVSPGLKLSYEVPPVNQDPSERNGAYVLGDAIYMDDERICSVDDVRLLGRHNLENVCAAIAATWDLIDNNTDAVVKALQDFTGLPHRLEFVREVNDVRYYNDSFAATPEASMAAAKAIPGDKVMIVGGFDRKLDLSLLAKELSEEPAVREILLIGQTGPRIASELAQLKSENVKHEVLRAKTMDEIVRAAQAKAQPGQAIVLSPGCPSFDMFKNFEERGLLFKKEVSEL